MNKHTYKSGITLIETIIYIGLMSLVIYGSIFITYHMIEIGGKNEESVYILNEVVFINKKINWALTNIESISVSSDGKILTISKLVSSPDNSIIIRGINGYIDMSTNLQSPFTLTNERYKVTNVNFTYDSTLKSVEVKYSIDGKKFSFNKFLTN
jgi:tricorn protease-like protein